MAPARLEPRSARWLAGSLARKPVSASRSSSSPRKRSARDPPLAGGRTDAPARDGERGGEGLRQGRRILARQITRVATTQRFVRGNVGIEGKEILRMADAAQRKAAGGNEIALPCRIQTAA